MLLDLGEMWFSIQCRSDATDVLYTVVIVVPSLYVEMADNKDDDDDGLEMIVTWCVMP